MIAFTSWFSSVYSIFFLSHEGFLRDGLGFAGYDAREVS